MHNPPSFVAQLLRAYHDQNSSLLDTIMPPTPNQVRFLCEMGLGPIAFRTFDEKLREVDSHAFSIFQSADLTTRVIYRQLDDALIEILKRLNRVGVIPVLLKGISTADEFYAPPHLRLMGDIDILIKPSEVEQSMTIIKDLGYEITEEAWRKYYKEGHHHLPEARNPETGISVEVHTGLFVPGSRIANEQIFQPQNIDAQIVNVDYKGTRAARFSPEFQFVYTIAHWTADGKWASNLTSINDVVHILRRDEPVLDWTTLEDWLKTNPCLIASTTALLRYLEQAEIIKGSPQMRGAIERSGGAVGPRTLKILMSLLDNHPFNARCKTYGEVAKWRARKLWRELNRPNGRDIWLPYSVLWARLRYIHLGRYNPLGWLVSAYRQFFDRP